MSLNYLEVDVRDPYKEAEAFRISDGRTGKDLTRLVKYSAGSQVAFVTRDGSYVGFLGIDDVDNLIKALQEAKRLWRPCGSTL